MYISSSYYFFFFSSRRRHTRFSRDWSSDVCSSDLWSRCRSWRAARCASPLPVAGGWSLRSHQRVGCPVSRVTGQPEKYWRLALPGCALGSLRAPPAVAWAGCRGRSPVAFAPLLLSRVDHTRSSGLEFVGLLLVRGGLLAAGMDFLDCHPGRRFLDGLVLQLFRRVGHSEQHVGCDQPADLRGGAGHQHGLRLAFPLLLAGQPQLLGA